MKNKKIAAGKNWSNCLKITKKFEIMQRHWIPEAFNGSNPHELLPSMRHAPQPLPFYITLFRGDSRFSEPSHSTGCIPARSWIWDRDLYCLRPLLTFYFLGYIMLYLIPLLTLASRHNTNDQIVYWTIPPNSVNNKEYAGGVRDHGKVAGIVFHVLALRPFRPF